MKKKRKEISASLRWQIFARDNFTCRYCGAQAGTINVQLHVDHIIPVVDGGTNEMDNLITACSRCNGGKGARRIHQLPSADEIESRMRERAESIQRQADALRAASEAQEVLKQQVVNLKCVAYGTTSAIFKRHEAQTIINLCNEFGAEIVSQWFQASAAAGVPDYNAIKYVCGCARNTREAAKAE